MYLTSLALHWEALITHLSCIDIFIKVKHPVIKDLSDCRETPLQVVLWKSATSMSGVQCVVILIGDMLMPKLLADS